MYCEIYGYSYEDASKKLNCPLGTIKSRLYNAKKELAEKLKDLLPMVERTKDPSTDKIEEDLAEKYKPCTSYLDLLTNIFASNFVQFGVLKFSARKGH